MNVAISATKDQKRVAHQKRYPIPKMQLENHLIITLVPNDEQDYE